jgi:hypothetical protein
MPDKRRIVPPLKAGLTEITTIQLVSHIMKGIAVFLLIGRQQTLEDLRLVLVKLNNHNASF